MSTNPNFSPPSEAQIKQAAINKGCTEDGAKKVAALVAADPTLDLQEVIKKVAAEKS